MGKINTYPEASSAASDDYLLLDGSTNGTRKIKPGSLIDPTGTQSGMAADAKLTKDEIDGVKNELDYLFNGKKIYNILEANNKQLSTGYAMNTNTGTVDVTTNNRHFAIPENYVPVSNIEKIVVSVDLSYTARIYYAFFDSNHTLIGTATRVDLSTESTIEISIIPDNAAYINVGGYSTGGANTQNACNTTVFIGIASFFNGLLDSALESEELPAQGKATGARLTALENLNETTGVRRLRLQVNSYNIPFSVKTGQTNLYLGYGSGGDNTEDWEGDTEHSRDNGHYNVAVGFEAFNQNVDGDHCTAVGYTCLKHNTTGDFNTAYGEDALYSNTTGSNNIAIGDHSAQNNNGSDNIVIGARVMRPATNANGNIVIGKEAGSVLDEGSNNILIGNGVNPSSDSSNNVIIGDSTHTSVIIAGKRIRFNQDGSVSWEPIQNA